MSIGVAGYRALPRECSHWAAGKLAGAHEHPFCLHYFSYCLSAYTLLRPLKHGKGKALQPQRSHLIRWMTESASKALFTALEIR